MKKKHRKNEYNMRIWIRMYIKTKNRNGTSESGKKKTKNKMCKQRKWQEKFAKKLQAMTGYEMAHTHTHTQWRWMESSLKSNQCPIDFDTFRAIDNEQWVSKSEVFGGYTPLFIVSFCIFLGQPTLNLIVDWRWHWPKVFKNYTHRKLSWY